MVLTFEWVSRSSVVGFCLALRGQRGCKLRTFITSRFFFLCLSLPFFSSRAAAAVVGVVGVVALHRLFDLIFYFFCGSVRRETSPRCRTS